MAQGKFLNPYLQKHLSRPSTETFYHHNTETFVSRIKLPARYYPLASHPEQARLQSSPARFKVVPAGRRSGKTEIAKRHLIKSALSATGPTPSFFAGAPTRDQAKRIYWEDLKAMSPKELVAKVSESELTVWYINDARVAVIGMDVPARVEGAPWDGCVLDEYANMKEETWTAHVRPALSDRAGWAWLIGVPEGRNHYYEIYKYAKADDTGLWDAFTWHSAEVLPLYGRGAEVEAARRDMDLLTFQQEYEASFVNFQGQAYYPFHEDLHCHHIRQFYKATGDLVFTFDFNVDPGTASIIQEMDFPISREVSKSITLGGRVLLKGHKETIHLHGTGVIGEVHIPQNSNTPAVVRKLLADWGDHKGRVFVYGDASGGARHSSQTEGSDWDHVKNMLYGHYGNDRVFFKVKDSNPSERARINAVNSRLKSADDVVHLMVDPKYAPNVVKDFEGVRLLEGGSGEIDKKVDPKLTHLTDGIGYYVEYEYPIRKETTVVHYA